MTHARRFAAVRAPLAALLLVALAAPAFAQAPSEDELARLSERLARASAVRLRTPEGEWVERRVKLGAGGVTLAGSPAYGANPVHPMQPALVPWERVAGLDLRKGGGNRGMLWGAFVGTIVTAALASRPRDEQSLGGADAFPLWVLCGAAVGAGLGSAVGAAGDPWTPAWPEPR